MRLRELFESLPLRQSIDFRKYWDPNTYKHIFRKYTDNPKAFRIYLPLVGADTPTNSEVKPSVERALNQINYDLIDYEKGYAKSSSDNRTVKIGKLIKDPVLLQKYNNDPARQLSKQSKLLVCISRHPYDIAGMSTDRGWVSCMHLTGGDNASYVMMDVVNGTIVAYLIAENDKNINNPKGRYLIKPFINEDNPDEILLVREQRAYGSTTPGFKETIDKWLDEVNGEKSEGLYCINPELYQDSNRTRLHYPSKSFDEVMDMIIQNPSKYNVAKNIKYKRNADGSIDLKANVYGALLRYLEQYNIIINELWGDYDCSSLQLSKLPISTPRIIHGDFDCSSNNLKSAKGFPERVHGEAIIYENQLDIDEVKKVMHADEINDFVF